MDSEIEIFNNYIKFFDMNNDKISLKYNHTFRVVNYAEQIARSLNLSEEDVNKAKICALFHDIGRFNQIKEYDTFDDNISVDHGDEGFRVLKELGYNDNIVLLSTKYHNKYDVPKDLDERTLLFCNITRDADKIDILIKQSIGLTKEEPISEKILNNMFSGKLIIYSDVSNQCEKIMQVLSYIFDINYIKTYELVKDNNVIELWMKSLLELSNNSKFKELENFLKDYVEKRINNVR